MHLFCAVVLNWFRSIDRNQSGARSVLWTGYVQTSWKRVLSYVDEEFSSPVVMTMDATLCL
jgi:hypothetical protein